MLRLSHIHSWTVNLRYDAPGACENGESSSFRNYTTSLKSGLIPFGAMETRRCKWTGHHKQCQYNKGKLNPVKNPGRDAVGHTWPCQYKVFAAGMPPIPGPPNGRHAIGGRLGLERHGICHQVGGGRLWHRGRRRSCWRPQDARLC